jgi:hypothetical protein
MRRSEADPFEDSVKMCPNILQDGTYQNIPYHNRYHMEQGNQPTRKEASDVSNECLEFLELIQVVLDASTKRDIVRDCGIKARRGDAFQGMQGERRS